MSTEDIRILMQQQLKLMELFAQKLSTSPSDNPSAQISAPTLESIASTITEFRFDPAACLTFDAWFRRFEDIFRVEFASQDDSWKVRTLLRKIGSVEHDRFCNFILPKTPREYSFDQVVCILKDIFGEQSSLFNIRFQCLNITKSEADDFVTYAGIVNRECERFKLGSLTNDQFKCLIFSCGLHSSIDADIRTRILAKIEQDPSITLQQITTECQRFLNLKHDTAMIQHRIQPTINSVNTLHRGSATSSHQKNSFNRHQSQVKPPRFQVPTDSHKPPSACWNCGEWHFVRFCPFRRTTCEKCNHIGHKTGFCRPKSFKGSSTNQPNKWGTQKQNLVSRSNSLIAKFTSNSASNRKYINVSINGFVVRMQIDTASDVTALSHRTWKLIGQPQLRSTNHVAISASGDPVHFTGELACSLKFKKAVTQGTCYVTKGTLNLLGLDMLSHLGLLDVPLNSICNAICKNTPPTSEVAATPTKIQETPKTAFNTDLGRCTKAQGEGTTEEVTQAFLLKYRTTPHPSIENNTSPAEALMGRKLRTTWDALDPRNDSKSAPSSEAHSKFETGTPVYARDYRTRYPKWQTGIIIRRRGNVLYDVRIGSKVWSRHRNQLRQRHTQSPQTQDTEFPLDVLLDTFDIQPVPPPINNKPMPNPNLQPRRWPERIRTPVDRLQVNPKQQTYL